MQPICFLAYLIACLHYRFAYLNTRGGTPCGVKAIKDVPGVENCNVTDLVESHTKYGDAIPNILQRVRFSEP